MVLPPGKCEELEDGSAGLGADGSCRSQAKERAKNIEGYVAFYKNKVNVEA